MTPSDHSLAFPADSSLHWEGHMYDGIATSYGRTPGAILHAHADALWLKGTRGDFFLPRQDIVALCRSGLYPWCFKGVQIRHRRNDLPETIAFPPLDNKTPPLLDELLKLGHPAR